MNLAPFYDVISESIRSVDPNRLVFFEPVTWGMIFNGELLGSGFDHVPGNRPDASVLSFHYYCWWYSEDSLNRKTCDRLFGPKVIEAIKRDMKAIGGSAMMTEWGQGCNFDDPNAVADPNSECNVIMDLLESHHIGWSDWYFGGQLNEHDFQMSAAARQIFSRTYARSIAGRPVTSLFDVASKKYRSCWTLPDDSITSDITEIFASFAVNYPNGVDVDTTPNIDVIEIIPSANSIKVRNHRNAVDRVACITIHPKSPAL